MGTVADFVIVNLKLSFRIKSAFFFTLAFPMVFYFVYVFGFGHGNPATIAHVLAALFTFVTVSNSIYGVSIPLIMSRELGVLRQYYLAPVHAWQILLARMLTSFVVLCIVLAVQVGLTFLFFGLYFWSQIPMLLIASLLGSLAISAIGCLISCLISSAQGGQIVNQLVFLTLVFFSGATVPLKFLPAPALQLANLLPSTQLFRAIDGILAGSSASAAVAVNLLGLVTFFALVFAASLACFRWDVRNKVGVVAKFGIAAAGICIVVGNHLLLLLAP